MLKKEIQHDTPTYKCNIINVQLALLDAIKKIDMIVNIYLCNFYEY